MTREQIQAILAGTKSVINGPWKVGENCAHVVSPEGYYVAWDCDPVDAEHIARCDPQTIKALCELALRGLQNTAPAFENTAPAKKTGVLK
jgi:hypothetical protein